VLVLHISGAASSVPAAMMTPMMAALVSGGHHRTAV
jgi:hypothetical protein